MVNALRRRAPARSRQTSGENVCINGTYNIDLKITVEWERELGLREVETLLLPFLGEARGAKEIRAFLSGHLRETDSELLPGKISRYRVAPNALSSLLETLEARGAVVCESNPESAGMRWRAAASEA